MLIVFFSGTFLSFVITDRESYTLTVEVENLRSSKGVVQFALYNKDGSIPDERYRKFYKLGKSEIVNGKASYTFTNLPHGRYAVNILHDENQNGRVDKAFILPKEGIGFSHYHSIGLSNRPNFVKASFELRKDESISVKVIYL